MPPADPHSPEPNAPGIRREHRQAAALCHTLAFCGYIVPAIGWILGPLIFWQIKKEESTFVDQQGREAVNFQITMMILFLVSWALTLVCVGWVLVIIQQILQVVLTVVATVRANDGEDYRYPFCIRFLK